MNPDDFNWDTPELTEIDLDELRESFNGSGLDWKRHCEINYPHLDSKAERKLKIECSKMQAVRDCGKEITNIGKDGLPAIGIYQCKRFDLCHKCRERRKKEHVDRLLSLDGCRYVFDQHVTSEYGKGAVYNFTLADGRKVSIIETDQPIGLEMNHNSIKELSNIGITGNRVSGNLGKKPNKEEVKERRTVMVTSHIIEALKEVKEAIKLEYYERTKDFMPKTLDELAAYLKQCNAIWLDIVNRRCEKNHVIGKKILVLTEDDVDWTQRKECIDKWLKEAEPIT